MSRSHHFLLPILFFALAVSCGRDFNRFPGSDSASFSLTSIEPLQGSNEIDVSIVLRGSNFIGNPRVLVGATECTSVAVVTSALITAVIPAGMDAGIYDVSLIGEDLDQDVITDAYTVIDPSTLTVTGIDPSEGLDNTPVTVTITGTNFLSGATASIGGTSLESVTVKDSTTITAVVPPGITPGTYDVIVYNSTIATARLLSGYTVLSSSVLQLTAIDPNHGPSDEDVVVTITGANFEGELTLLLGPNILDEMTVITSEMITATIPAGFDPGIYTVRLIDAEDNMAELEDGYTVDEPTDDDDDDTADDDDASPTDDDDDDNDDNDNDNDDDDDDDDDDTDETADDDDF